jgi:glucose/arabinose dehydrogenase
MTATARLMVISLSILLTACGDNAQVPEEATTGPSPTLPEPNPTLIPTVNVAAAKGWPQGEAPTAASGLAVYAYALGLDHPRWLYVLPTSLSPRRMRRRGRKRVKASRAW